MSDRDEKPQDANEPLQVRDSYGFKENPAPQGLKKPPTNFGIDEDSGEWTRGGGTDPNEPPREGGPSGA